LLLTKASQNCFLWTMANQTNFITQQTNSLTEIEQEIWQLLHQATLSAKEPFHTGVLATLGQGGANLRTVVLRKVLQAQKMLIFHTDIRSDKVSDIQQNPRVSWLFYDAPRRIQIRLSGIAKIHIDDELTAIQWQTSRLSSRKCYLTQFAPGSLSDCPQSGLPEGMDEREPNEAECEAGKPNFAVISTRVDDIDWLWLNHNGHRRAQFDWRAGELTANWVIP
jgi:pyridoxamine 5'-phosphate oxidase